VEPKSAPQKIDFEGQYTQEGILSRFYTNGQTDHTCVGPQKL